MALIVRPVPPALQQLPRPISALLLCDVPEPRSSHAARPRHLFHLVLKTLLEQGNIIRRVMVVLFQELGRRLEQFLPRKLLVLGLVLQLLQIQWVDQILLHVGIFVGLCRHIEALNLQIVVPLRLRTVERGLRVRKLLNATRSFALEIAFEI